MRSCLTLLVYAGVLVILFLTYKFFFYEAEMNLIKWRINMIPNAEVVSIWGHKDVTLEHICAKIKISDNGEVALGGIDWRDFRYPEVVPMISIGGYSFMTFTCYEKYWSTGIYGPGIVCSVDIGCSSPIGRELGLTFNEVSDVIENYDVIIQYVRSLRQAPEWNLLQTEDKEIFLFVIKSSDHDLTNEFFRISKKFDGGLRLPWTRHCQVE